MCSLNIFRSISSTFWEDHGRLTSIFVRNQPDLWQKSGDSETKQLELRWCDHPCSLPDLTCWILAVEDPVDAPGGNLDHWRNLPLMVFFPTESLEKPGKKGALEPKPQNCIVWQSEHKKILVKGQKSKQVLGHVGSGCPSEHWLCRPRRSNWSHTSHHL